MPTSNTAPYYALRESFRGCLFAKSAEYGLEQIPDDDVLAPWFSKLYVRCKDVDAELTGSIVEDVLKEYLLLNPIVGVP